MISVGIIGGTGYTGKYLLEFIQKHENVSDYTIYANNSAGSQLLDVFPELLGVIENQTIESVDSLSYSHDLYFISLPHGESLKYVPLLLEKGIKVIDLGGDYRLDSEKLYKEWYQFDHTSADLLATKVYGLADINNGKILNSEFIANPGCYPTSIQLALIPLLKYYSNNIISISSVSYSGASGAGKSPKTELLLSELDGNVKAYNVNKHRHQPEIEQELKKYGMNSPFAFTTHLLPIARGIYSTSTIHLNYAISEEEISEKYLKEYANCKFVRMRNVPPELKWVVNTNFCDINISAKNKTVIITSTIDNLIKGASGQAIQNMNKMFGWNETLGLLNKNNN
ncbi:MAG: N-acetyl-gamma-glutamyl-phosphate reductase [Bacteroidetes bacterium]|nr:N-acetyl-gamma-glutamyl-phosphate reductase [Bacteroidota bacterium]MBU1113798.1 N-acetyl-gamma-glutamyl-phosphate reductase [Bacteroidota bacterium]MBU1798294.1 N-acetyl-gamma-glutamyl-phosphate reductase [Bacteroidota bacterium]